MIFSLVFTLTINVETSSRLSNQSPFVFFIVSGSQWGFSHLMNGANNILLNTLFLPITAVPCQLSRDPKACHTGQQRLPQAFLSSPLPQTNLLVALELPPMIYQSSPLCSGQPAETANQKYPRSKLRARIRRSFKMCLVECGYLNF